MSMLTAGILVFFLSTSFGIYVLQGALIERRQLYRSLRTVKAMELSSGDIHQRRLAVPFLERTGLPALKAMARLGKRLTPGSVLERIARELAYAGSPPAWDVERVLAFKVLAGAIAALSAVTLWLMGSGSAFKALVLTVVISACGYYLPDLILKARARKRQDALQRSLPDALDLLSITVSAGLGFDAAMARLSQEIGGPLAHEMHRVRQEMQIGLSRAEALRKLAERTTVDELKSFVLAMVQADVFGVSIADVLHVQAGEMRIKRRQRAEERAQKVPVKIIFPVLLCIFPALFIVLLGPAVISIFKSLSNV